MSDISRSFRETLTSRTRISVPMIDLISEAKDGTVKLRLALSDGKKVESVLIFDPPRTTLCVSSQVGCSLGCRFCQTATMGLVRNLTSAEILGQVLTAKRHLAETGGRITNIVFMGMGEPLLNYAEVGRALDVICAQWGFGFSWRRVTLSTAGIVDMIKILGADRLINLAVSLNAADDDTRSLIMPVNRAHPLEELMAALRDYPLKKGRRITLEYVMLGGVNDSVEDARKLVRLIHGLKTKVNLIPFNPYPGAGFERPTDSVVEAFRQVLIDAHVNAIVRKSAGGDVSAACGQLVTMTSDTKESSKKRNAK
jgi:23S rRNA (adenine2503-C2)-methyltransferase